MTTERTPRPGTAWESELLRVERIVCEEDDGNPFAWIEAPAPVANRKTRRALRRKTKTSDQEQQ